MLLPREDAELFFKLHRSFMFFVNERLGVVPDVESPEAFSALPNEARLEVRNAFLDEVDLIELFVDANPFDFNDSELEVVSSWRHHVTGKFFLFRYLKNQAIFLTTEDPPTAYGVAALTQPFDDLIGPYLPVWIETMLLPLRDKIVYDGLLRTYNVSFGPGIRRGLNESYKAAKERLGIVTSLPAEAHPTVQQSPKTKNLKRDASRESPKNAKGILEVVGGMVDQFCRERLSDEYAVLCRKLAEKLVRNRPSPLLKGKPNGWASGIVRTIGWVNFLDDPSQRPHLKMAAIDQVFGVSGSTGQAKSMLIRRMFAIQPLDPEWTLPSRMDDNPLVWMVEVNGFLLDMRHCPREVQEIAFEKGLIPYVQAGKA